MAEQCSRRNPLQRSGTTQSARLRSELSADHFLPDERDYAELILFGQRLAKQVRYYNRDNVEEGDWSVFFESDASARLAALAKLPTDLFRNTQTDLETWLQADPQRASEQLASHARLVFHLPLALLKEATQHLQGLPATHPLHSLLTDLLRRDLAKPLMDLVAWYKGAFDAGLGAGNQAFDDQTLQPGEFKVDHGSADARPLLPDPVQAMLPWGKRLTEIELPSDTLISLEADDWTAFCSAVAADSAPYADAIGEPRQRYEQIRDALNYNLLTRAIERIYVGLERLRRVAVDQLQDVLAGSGLHAPQHGLWLAFLALFQHARGELNQFTARHLDFHFREVLRLRPRPAQPNQVHLLFTLARNHDKQLLPAGTALNAGKDGLGKALRYELDKDLVVSRAQVTAIRGIQLLIGGSAAQPTVRPLAASEVRSRDGSGEIKLPDDDPGWPPFGPDQSPPARIGFAVADRKLFLREGERTIRLQIEFDPPLRPGSSLPRWIVRLSGPEGWVELDGNAQITTRLRAPAKPAPSVPVSSARASVLRSTLAPHVLAPFAPAPFAPAPFALAPNAVSPAPQPKILPRLSVLELTLKLSAEIPAIVPLEHAVHGTEHAPGLPTAEFVIDFGASESARAFALLRKATIRKLDLAVEASGLKQLMVIGGDAMVDSASAFAPFGPRPAAGAQWVIGSSEIFSKPIARFSLEVSWASQYNATDFFWKHAADDYNATEEVLSGGKWRTTGIGLLQPVALQARSPAASSSIASVSKSVSAVAPSSTWMQTAPFAPVAPRGGSRRSDKTDIGLDKTHARIELRCARLIDGLCAQTLENPELGTTSVNGFVRLRLPLDFGHQAFATENARALIARIQVPNDYEQNAAPNLDGGLPRQPYDPLITRLEANYESTSDTVASFSLLHPFGSVPASAIGSSLFPALPNEGELLIGIEHFQPPARLNLLVQVLDGSGDPLQQAPTLQFHYLQDDEWRDFAPQDVDDGSANFTTSGILGLKLPAAANRDHRLLPGGLHWVRIAAPVKAAALNRLLSVDAQAARARFVDQNNDPAFLAAALPAGSISRLAEARPAIAKVSQPYSSFGGRPLEAERAFATRVSERLRHKDRATTLWDYENLVLEAFPQLYRVKCLGTTELMRDAQGTIVADNEVMPGAVTVVTVPWTHRSGQRDPLRPYTDQATLVAVERFLRQRISPFVRLEVQNPHFEEVQADFEVKFRPEASDIGFQLEQLKTALVDFLTPWAGSGGGEIHFGGSLWKSSIIDFIEAQPQVDFVTDFHLYHLIDVGNTGTATRLDVEQVQASSARSILVSAPTHLIREIATDA